MRTPPSIEQRPDPVLDVPADRFIVEERDPLWGLTVLLALSIGGNLGSMILLLAVIVLMLGDRL